MILQIPHRVYSGLYTKCQEIFREFFFSSLSGWVQIIIWTQNNLPYSINQKRTKFKYLKLDGTSWNSRPIWLNIFNQHKFQFIQIEIMVPAKDRGCLLKMLVTINNLLLLQSLDKPNQSLAPRTIKNLWYWKWWRFLTKYLVPAFLRNGKTFGVMVFQEWNLTIQWINGFGESFIN